MRSGKFSLSIKNLIILACFIALIAVGTSAAYITSITSTVKNEFTPANVSCSVEENFNGDVKQDVKIRNTGNVPAYIRATVLVNWVSVSDGKVLAELPVEGTDYSIIWGSRGWIKAADSFWYHKDAVAADSLTENIINSVKPITTKEGYQLSVKILATAIQSDPQSVVVNEWGVTVVDSKIIQ